MNNNLSNWDNIATNSLNELGVKIASVLPDILAAIVVLVIGFFIAGALGNLARRLLRMTGIDNLMKAHPITAHLHSANMRFTPSRVIGWMVKWFFILVALITASNILGWTQINEFLNQVILYIPNVIIAVVILVIGFVVSQFVANVINAALEEVPLRPYQRSFLSSGAKVAIIVLAFMAALIQLKIATYIVEALITGFVFALSLASGLAFGLGGREQAGEFLRRHMQIGTGANSGASSGPADSVLPPR